MADDIPCSHKGVARPEGRVPKHVGKAKQRQSMRGSKPRRDQAACGRNQLEAKQNKDKVGQTVEFTKTMQELPQSKAKAF